MQFISEPKYLWGFHFIAPLLIVLGQYCTTIMMVLMLIYLDCTLEITILISIVVLIAIVLIPFWYKTFFNSTYIGASPLLYIEWSDNEIHFRGAYFDIKISPGSIIKYKITGFHKWDPYIVTLKIKTKEGKKRTIRLSPTFRGKAFLINFLEELNIKRTYGIFSPAE